jgi:hypothetical protein
MSFQFIRRVLSCSNRFYLGIFALVVECAVASSIEKSNEGMNVIIATTGAYVVYESIHMVLVQPLLLKSSSRKQSVSSSQSKEPLGQGDWDHQLDPKSQHIEEGHYLDQATSFS